MSRAACVLWRSTESRTSIDSAEAATNGMTIVIGPIQPLDANALGRLERLRAFAHGALEQLSAEQQRCALSVSTFSAWLSSHWESAALARAVRTHSVPGLRAFALSSVVARAAD